MEVLIYDARMQQNGHCTCVRHDDTRATSLPARRCWVWFFFSFFYGFLSTWLRFAPTWLWFALNRADSARIGLYRPNRSVLAGGQNWPKQPKQTKMAEIDLESCIALAKNWNLSLTVELKPTNLSLTWVETLNWIQRYSHIHQHHRNPQQHNYYSTLLAYNQVSCNIKRLWLPQNALCFLFYWTH